GTYFEATEEVVLPEMAERLFTLKPRELSGPFRTRSGWHIMKVLQLNKPGRVPYEKVREELRQNLMVEAREERIAELVKGARNVMEIEVFRTPEDSSNTEGSKKEQAGGVNGAAS
ncbi:MAG: peptidyl-prolyl cis-trans isomerase, partial [Candidatus Hydrogenedentes bacterium]|nr:peptidyl-prolyl cis-trans isomerase [Candidatus Hydrogenedentota bacterium]